MLACGLCVCIWGEAEHSELYEPQVSAGFWYQPLQPLHPFSWSKQDSRGVGAEALVLATGASPPEAGLAAVHC